MADPLDNMDSGEQLRRLLLKEEQDRLDRLEARLGNDHTLKISLVPIIADVLRDAGVTDYKRLAGALAPVVLHSIKTEIQNSRDMMVDALYPITGRLVAAAVRNAFRDLVEQLNQKLDKSLSVDRWRARIKAKMTGRSEAEILLSEGAAFEITDLLLINRETGFLIAQTGADANESDMDSQLLGSVLTAIMAFVRDAMQEASEQDLRTLHVGDMRLHLQVSPGVILAIKTRGPPPAGFDSALNETFCAFLARWGRTLADPDDVAADDQRALANDLEERFSSLLKAKQSNFKAPSKKGVILLSLFTMIAVSLIGWHLYSRWERARVEADVRAVIADLPGLAGYPLRVRHRADGSLSVVGLTPDRQSLDALQTTLAQVLPDEALAFEIQALPEPSVELDHLAMVDDVARRAASLREELTDLVDRETAALRLLIRSVERGLPLTEEQQIATFRTWLDRQSLRFDDGARLRDEQVTGTLLRDLVRRLKQLPRRVGLVVVGYTDDIGSDEANKEVSLARALMVTTRLMSMGLASSRVTAVGRGDERLISQQQGASSINRRVEFELTFLDSHKIPDVGAANTDGGDVER